MRRQLGILAFAVLAMMATGPRAAASASDEVSASAAPTIAVHRVNLALPAVRDEATMVLVGTALICLGAAVRRVG